MRLLYSITTIIFYPIILFYLVYRRYKGKENNLSLCQKLGYKNKYRPDGYLIWIHVASVGEYQSVKLLIDRLIEKYHSNILITSNTISAAKIITQKKSDRIIHQYIPIDNIYIVKKFLKYWSPNLILWVDSELWPNILHEASKIASIILINGKISEKSYNRWIKFKNSFRETLNNFSIILPQTLEYSMRFKSLDITNVKYIGNIKYSAASDKIDINRLESIRKLIPSDKVILIAASTHEGEELIISRIYANIKKKISNIFLIIAPRHPNRINEISAELRSFSLAVRSKNDIVSDETDIYIADTLGELKYFYKVSDIAFIGGSFVNIGGHNPLEAAESRCAIVYGPCYTGFKEIIKEMLNVNAIKIASNQLDLENIIFEFLNEPKKLSDFAIAAKRIIGEKSNIIEEYLNEIQNYIQ